MRFKGANAFSSRKIFKPHVLKEPLDFSNRSMLKTYVLIYEKTTRKLKTCDKTNGIPKKTKPTRRMPEWGSKHYVLTGSIHFSAINLRKPYVVKEHYDKQQQN